MMMRVMCSAAAVIAGACLAGACARAATRGLAARRLRRNLFHHLGRNRPGGEEYAAVVSTPSTAASIVVHIDPFFPWWVRRRFDAWTYVSLAAGAVWCSWHLLCAPKLFAPSAVAVACGFNWIVTTAWPWIDWRDETRVRLAGRVLAIVFYPVFSAFGAVCLAVDGIAHFVGNMRDMTVTERAHADAERLERERISSRAFRSVSFAATAVYLHQDHNCSESFLLSVVGPDALLGRRLTAYVTTDSNVFVALDRYTMDSTAPVALHRPPAHADVVRGLRYLRASLSALSECDAFAEMLSLAAGEALASEHAEHERGARAQRMIRRAWTKAVTDPGHPACIRRLRFEADELCVLLRGV